MDADEAEKLRVYVRDRELLLSSEYVDMSYHEEPGCYGADEEVSFREAVENGAVPCGLCCYSFEVVRECPHCGKPIPESAIQG